MKRRRFLHLSSGALGLLTDAGCLRCRGLERVLSHGPLIPTSPTASETPQSLDDIWQMASAKYWHGPQRSA